MMDHIFRTERFSINPNEVKSGNIDTRALKTLSVLLMLKKKLNYKYLLV